MYYNTMASYQFNPINILDTTNATSLTNGGSMTLGGGISIGKDTLIGGNVSISGTTTAFSDNILLVNNNPTSSTDTGIIFKRYTSDIQNNNNYAGIIYSEQNDSFNLGYLVSDPNRNYVTIDSLVPLNVKDITTGNINMSGDIYKNGSLYNPGSQWVTSNSDIYYTTGNVNTSNLITTNISANNIRLTNDLYVGGTLYTVNVTTTNVHDINITTGTINVTGISNLNNVTATNLSTGTINVSIGITTGTLTATTSISSASIRGTNIIGNSISVGTLIGTTFTGANMSLSGNLNIGGTLTTVNITSTNMLNTNISAGTINASGTSTLQNVTATNVSAGTLTASTGITTGTITASTGITTGTITANYIRLDAGTALDFIGNIDAANLTQTYIAFGPAGSSSDSSYLRQLGGTNSYKMALDINDDGDEPGFCIRSVKSTDTPDTINERFTVQAGGNVGINNSSPTANLDVVGTVKVSGLSSLANVTATNISTGTLTASTGITTGTITASTGITTGTITANYIRLDAGTALDFIGNIDAANLTQTYIAFGPAGTTNDSSYLRQLGGNNSYKMALDINDDGDDPGFCIRSVQSTNTPDTINERFTVQAGGNVGINNSSPTANLDVVGTVKVSGLSALANLTATNISTGTLTASTSLISIGNSNTVGNIYTTGGNVGIGTGSPVEKLEVRGNLRIGNSSQSNYISFHGTTLDGPNEFTHTYIGERLYGGTEASELLLFKGNDSDNGAGPDRIRHLAGNHVFATYTSALSGTFEGVGTSGTTRMLIDRNGLVGIGTTSPAYTLDVAGTAKIGGNNIYNKILTLYDSGVSDAPTGATNFYGFGINSGTLRYQVPSVNAHLFYTGSTGSMIIATSGNVGIATTSPAYTLDVNGTSRLSGGSGGTTSSLLFSGIDDGGNNRLVFTHSSEQSRYQKIALQTRSLVGSSNGGRANFYIQVNTANNTSNASISDTRLYIDGLNGNVGIATTSPAYTLDVAGTAKIGGNNIYNKILTLYDSGVSDAPTGATNFYGFGINSGTLRYQVPSINSHLFYTGSTGSMIIATSGNVGIATTSPAYTLDVNGTGLFRNGDGAGGFSRNQLTFGWENSASYMHTIKTRHNGLANNINNAFDFYTWQTSDAVTAVGTKHVMSVTSVGVGIATTSPAYTLDVNGTGRFANGLTIATASPAVFTNKTITSNPNFGMIHCADRPTAGNLGSFLFANADASVAYISINTPAYTLDVNGTANVSGTAKIGGNNIYNKILALYDSVGDAPTGATNFYGFGINGGTLRYQVPSGERHLFYTGSTGSMIIATGGNVGIATTSPAYTLDVAGTAKIGGTHSTLEQQYSTSSFPSGSCTKISGNSAASGTTLEIFSGHSSTNDRYLLRAKRDTADYFSIRMDGKVGVGTASPAYTLDVNGTAKIGGNNVYNKLLTLYDIGVNDAPTGATNFYGFGIDGSLRYQVPNNNSHVFYSGSTANMMITGNGLVGIRTDIAYYTLDVNGTGRFANGLTIATSQPASYSNRTITSNTNYGLIYCADRPIAGNLGSALFCNSNATINYMTLNSVNYTMVVHGSAKIDSNLHISESTGTAAGANTGSIILDHDNNGGASSIVFRSKTNRGSDYGYIQYQDASTVGGGGEDAKLIIGTQNDTIDNIYLSPTGSLFIKNGAYFTGNGTGDQFVVHANGSNGAGGYFYYNANNVYGTVSDERTKYDITPINSEDAIAFISNITPSDFSLNGQTEKQAGFIAQNVLAAAQNDAQKSAVGKWETYDETNPDCPLIGVSDRPILSNLIVMVKHQQTYIQNLEATIISLKARLTAAGL